MTIVRTSVAAAVSSDDHDSNEPNSDSDARSNDGADPSCRVPKWHQQPGAGKNGSPTRRTGFAGVTNVHYIFEFVVACIFYALRIMQCFGCGFMAQGCHCLQRTDVAPTAVRHTIKCMQHHDQCNPSLQFIVLLCSMTPFNGTDLCKGVCPEMHMLQYEADSVTQCHLSIHNGSNDEYKCVQHGNCSEKSCSDLQVLVDKLPGRPRTWASRAAATAALRPNQTDTSGRHLGYC